MPDCFSKALASYRRYKENLVLPNLCMMGCPVCSPLSFLSSSPIGFLGFVHPLEGWQGPGQGVPRQPTSSQCLKRREASQSLMRPEEVVHGLDDGEGPVPSREGFEAPQRADPAPYGAVQPLQEVVAPRDQPSSMADRCALELGDDTPGLGDGLRYGRRIGRGSVGDDDIGYEACLRPGLPQRPGRRLLVPPPGQLQGDDVPPVVLHDVDLALPAPEPDMELVHMPYTGVLGPISAGGSGSCR